MPTETKYSATTLIVDDTYATQRLDNYLLRELHRPPRDLIYRLIRRGAIKLNDNKTQPSARLAINDRISLPSALSVRAPDYSHIDKKRAKESSILPQLIYQDDHLLVLNKPANLAVHGGSGWSLGLIEQMRLHFTDTQLHLAHRLDRDTSGLLVLCKSYQALRNLHRQWQIRKVHKIYLAASFGKWQPHHSKISAPILRLPRIKGQPAVKIDNQGAMSHTNSQLISNFKLNLSKPTACSLIKLEPLTGKTHQIRIHLSHYGLPIIGDNRYGNFPLNQLTIKPGMYKQMMLHAYKLKFQHPIKIDQELELCAPPPPCFLSPPINFQNDSD